MLYIKYNLCKKIKLRNILLLDLFQLQQTNIATIPFCDSLITLYLIHFQRINISMFSEFEK